MTAVAVINYQQHIPNVLKAFLEAETQIRQSGLSDTLYHLVKLRASQINECAYCVKMHTAEARADGESEDRLNRLVVWRHVGDFTDAERAALAWTEALTKLDEKEDYGQLRLDLKDHFSDEEISAITAVTAMINLWNRIGISNH